MTSYQPPDYDVEVQISQIDFRAIAGTAIDVSIAFTENMQRYSGMLIVPQGNEFLETSQTANAWLWCEGYTDGSAGTKVNITLGLPCDPVLTPEENAALATLSGLIIEGFITRNWNTGPGVGIEA